MNPQNRLDELVTKALRSGNRPSGLQLPPRADRERPVPLSAAQLRLWLLGRMDGDSDAYHSPLALRLDGPVDAEALLAAARDLVERHEILRSVISVTDGRPSTTVAPVQAVPISLIEVRSSEEEDAVVRREVRRPFSLSTEPPTRVTLVRTGSDHHTLLLMFHHIAVDAHSFGLLLADLGVLYAARTGTGPGPLEPAPQHADAVVWDLDQRDEAEEAEQLRWWAKRLAGLPELRLPADRPRPAAADWTGARVPVTLSGAAVRSVAARTGCTPYMAVLACWQLLLSRLADATEFGVGAAHAGRGRRELAEVVGYFVNTVVVPADLSGQLTGRQLMERVRENVLESFAHADAPFDRVVQELAPERSRATTPIYQTMVNLLDRPADVAFGPVTASPMAPRNDHVQVDLCLELTDTGADFEGELAFRAELFASESVRRWAGWLSILVEELACGLDRPLAELDFVSESEKALLAEWSEGGGPLPAPDATVVDAVLAQARRRPDATATAAPGGTLTYGELDAESERVARLLIEAGVRPGATVGVCLPRDQRLPGALLAVWRAGAAYTPLDPADPPSRSAWLASDAGALVVLTRGAAFTAAQALADQANSTGGRRLTVVDADRAVLTEPSAAQPHAPLPQVGPEAVAYVLHTSGSTGRPKAVEITHASLAALAAATRARPGLGAQDVALVIAPLAFDASVIEMWPALSAGARCVVVERDCAIDGRALAERIAATGATFALLSPTSLRMLLAAGWTGQPGLRVCSGGEVLDGELAAALTAGVTELWNLYGPTEDTVASTAHRVSPADTTQPGGVPIGKPLPGERIHVVTQDGRLAPPGVVGELWVGGSGLARGYRGRPELTAGAFVDDPFVAGGRCYRTGDLGRWSVRGELEFVGRRDHQVKLRGIRVELGEIETALVEQPGVTAAAVLVRGTGADAHLVAYVEIAETAAGAGELESALRNRLPRHLVPRRWATVTALPRLAGGKVDRKALPEVDAALSDVPRRTPEGDAELLVAEVWCAVLGAGRIHADDDFFALGGHSLAATKVAARLGDALGVELPVRFLFDHSTLADLARAIEALLTAELESPAQATGGTR